MTEKIYKPYLGSEADFQKSLAKYLDSVGLEWFHPANGELRNKATAAKLKSMGVKPGVPDVIIIRPIHKEIISVGMCIELKVGRNKLSEHQKDWALKFNRHDWLHVLTRSLDEIIDIINYYYEL